MDTAAQNIIPFPTPIIVTPPAKQFTPPSLEECRLRAAKIGLPDVEAHKFFYYYESKGWVVGRAKMKNWHMAMSGWKLRSCSADGRSSPIQLKILSDEYDRVLDRIRFLRGERDHGGLTEPQRRELDDRKVRSEELRSLLGITI